MQKKYQRIATVNRLSKRSGPSTVLKNSSKHLPGCVGQSETKHSCPICRLQVEGNFPVFAVNRSLHCDTFPPSLRNGIEVVSRRLQLCHLQLRRNFFRRDNVPQGCNERGLTRFGQSHNQNLTRRRCHS